MIPTQRPVPTPETLTDCATSPQLWDEVRSAEHPAYMGLRRICAACPVLQACGEYALTHDVAGFAAGMTELQRAHLVSRAS